MSLRPVAATGARRVPLSLRTVRFLVLLSFLLQGSLCSSLSAASDAASPAAQYVKLPLSFERQDDKGAQQFVARGSGYSVALSGGAARIVVGGKDPNAASVVSMEFAGARRAPGIAGDELLGKVNYMHGRDPNQWKLGLPTYGRVTYQGIYPKMDVSYYGNQQQLEFDVVLQPGADLNHIRIKFGGTKGLALEKDGSLLIHSAAGDLRVPLPAIYQKIGQERRAVPGHYRLLAKGEVGFRVDGYDKTKPLVIDPTIVYAGLIGGGNNSTFGQGIALDASGNAYLTGYTYAWDFPTANAAYAQLHLTPDGFVTKIDPTGTTLLYSTFVGGGSTDIFSGIAVDSSGSAWVTGYSYSFDFPVMNAYQSTLNGSPNAVVLKLSSSGSLQYSSFFGSTNVFGQGVAVDASGNAYVAGYVPTGGSVPTTTGAFQTASQGSYDAFAAKFTSTGGLTYCTYLGGTGTDLAFAIAVDSGGNAYVGGYSFSSTFTGAPSGGAHGANTGNGDAFVAKLNASASALTYFTFLGGTGFEEVKGISVDQSGDAYIAGYTNSTDFPTSAGALQTVYGGGNQDGFVAKLSSDGSSFNYVTYLGGSRNDIVYGIGSDSAGNAYITGSTQSTNFPTLSPIEGGLTGNPTSLFRTTDGASTWTAFDQNIGGVVVNISPDPVTSGVLVAATDSGVFRTANGGASWTRTLSVGASTGTGNAMSRSLANSNTIYFYNSNSVWRSSDGGQTWGNGVGVGLNSSSAWIVADPLTINTAYVAGTASTIYKTTDGGATWNPVNTGLPGFTVESLVASADGSIYMDTSSTNVYRSTNQGVSWTGSTGLTANGVVGGLGVSLSSPSVLYRSNGSFVYKSTNSGASFTPVPGSLPLSPLVLAVSPANSTLVLASVGNPLTLYASGDGGTSWGQISTGLQTATLTHVVFDPFSTSTGYAVATVPISGFVSEINPTGTALVYSTYLGATVQSLGAAIAVNGTGDAFVGGYNSGVGFPSTTTAWQGSSNSFNAFVARITGTTPACSYTVSPLSRTLTSGYQTAVFSVVAPSGCAWTASAPNNQNWAAVIGGASGTGSGEVFVSIASNTSGSSQTTSLTIANQTATLTQAPTSCTYGLGASTLSLPSTGGSVSVIVNTAAGCPWAVTNNFPFTMSVTSGASGTGTGTVNLSIGPNANETSRTINVPIGGNSINISQAGYCTFVVSPTNPFFPAAGGNGSITVTTGTGCSWTASGTTWLTINSGSAGNGSGTVNFTVAANTGAGRTFSTSIGAQTVLYTQLPSEGYIISTVAGGQVPATTEAATAAALFRPFAITTDGTGNVYFTDTGTHAIFKRDTSGNLTRLAGTGVAGFSGDGGPATSALMNSPQGVAVDSSGNVYVADTNNHRIRKIDGTGTITTVAGTGTPGFVGDGGNALAAQINSPHGLVIDTAGNLYFNDTNNVRIRKLDTGGNISTVAGNGSSGFSGDNGAATSAQISSSDGLAVDAAGNLYIADSNNFRVRKVSGGIITTVAGNGSSGFSGDNGVATNAQISFSDSLTVDGAGNLYIADTNNHRVRMIAPNGIITTIAGTGSSGYTGDGNPATLFQLSSPSGVAIDSTGALYIADNGNRRIRRLSAGTIATVAGGGPGDSAPAPFSGLNQPYAVAKDSAGNVYVADTFNHRIRMITPAGQISTIAGTGAAGYSGDNGPAASAQLAYPYGVAVDASGNVYIADTNNYRIRKVSGGTITTIAGTGICCYSGDGGPAINAQFNVPRGLAFDASGNLYIADAGNNRVRKVTTGGTITTVAGNGACCYSGDNIAATSAELNNPFAIALDASGNLYIADTNNFRIRKVDLSGNITTVAGIGSSGFSGDGGTATSAQINFTYGITVDSSGNLFIADTSNNRIREITAGTIVTVGGTGSANYTGDGNPAIGAAMSAPRGLTVDSTGALYVAESSNNLVRLMTPVSGPAVLTVTSTHSGSFTPGSSGQYTVTVTNGAFAGAATGTVTVTEILPAGLVMSGMTGSGWNCGTNTCSRSDGLAAGTSFPQITVTVSVASPAPSQVTNQVTVAGGAAETGAEDLTLITGSAPAAPTLVSPVNGATSVSLSTSLTWNSASGATSYDVYAGTTWPPPFVTNTALTTYSPAGLVAATTYYWQIVAKNGSHTTGSTIWSFTTIPTGNCTYTLNPTAGTVSANGGTGTVTVTAPAGCSWTAMSNQTWLDVTGGASGSGNGTVSYSAAAGAGSERTATLTIAGQPFVVTQLAPYLISTIAGGAMPATAATGPSQVIGSPQSSLVDATGNLYFASAILHSVFRLDTSGVLTRLAGTGLPGYSGDNGPALNAQLNNPWGLAMDSTGNLYVADTSNERVRKIDLTGTITTVAGNGFCCYSGDNGPAVSAMLNAPRGLAIDASGNLYIADQSNYRIRKVSTNGTITTFAGIGICCYSGDNGPATSAQVNAPAGVAVDSAGNLYIADTNGERIRKVATNGTITTVAGNGSCCFSGDNGPATSAQLNAPNGISVDSLGNLYIADTNNQRIRMVAPNGIISTIAGTGSSGYIGDGGTATGTQLSGPDGVAVDASGNLYIADTGNRRMRRITSGVITTAAGGGTGDSAPAPFGGFNQPYSVARDSAGNIYVADALNHRVRMITPAGVVSTFAGTGKSGFSGDNGPAASAQLSFPYGVAVDAAGNVYIADSNNYRIRKVSGGTITTYAGTGTCCFSGDGGPATGAWLNSPRGVAVDAAGNLYIADTSNNRIRKVSTGGTITTIVGTGSCCYGGDNGPATSAQISSPWSVTVDASGNLYIADTNNARIRKVDLTNTITTIAGTGSSGFSGDGGAATSAQINSPYGVAADSSGNVFFSDTSNNRVREVTSTGIIVTLGGTGSFNYNGDGGVGISAAMAAPRSLMVDSTGALLVAESGNNLVRRLTPAGGQAVLTVSSVHSSIFTPGTTGQYTVTVANASFAGATSGTVTVSEFAPAGLSVTGMSGTGWSCGTTTCTRGDSLAGGSSYPAITVTVNVGSPAPLQVTNQVTVSGGGAAQLGAEDLTVIGGAGPSTPLLISPANGSSANSLSASLIWGSASGATSYDVYFGTSSPPAFATNTVSTAFSPSGLATGTTYYWQVVAKNASHTTSSSIWSFTTIPAGGCTYLLSPTSATISSDGGAGSFTVTAPSGCPWTALSNQSWLDVTAGASGSGNGTVSYSAGVSAGALRSATISLGGQTFGVTQLGPYTISTLAGGMLPATSTDGGSATFGNLPSVATDASGNVYFASGILNSVFRLDTTGLLTRLAGNGTPGYSGDNGPATSAQLSGPWGVALDAAGNVYVSDANNERVRKIDGTGTITTVAGNGSCCYSGDNGLATNAQLNAPRGIAFDGAGNLYIADSGNQRIRKVSNGIITTAAGNGACCYGGDGGPATSALFNSPSGVALDSNGNLYIADTNNNRIRQVTTGGTVNTVAGNGSCCYSGDNGPATSAQLNSPFGITVDSAGNLYIADSNNSRIRLVAGGTISTLAGTNGNGFTGDGVSATTTQLNFPYATALDTYGNLYIADNNNHRIRKVNAGTITTAAGGATGDSGAAPFSGMNQPWGTAKDSAGNIYVADTWNHRIRKITPSGQISTYAGNGLAGFSGDNGPAVSAQLSYPYGVALDASGNLYIADTSNERIRKVTPGGTISTVAGNGNCCYAGDSGPATSARLNSPHSVAIDGSGNLYIADTSNNRIRKVTPGGTITTSAGNGFCCYSGDNGLATNANLNSPWGVAADSSGNVYIADTSNNRIRKVDTNGTITTVAGNGSSGYSGDDGPATSAQINNPYGIAVDASGNLFIGDTNNNRVREVTSGAIVTVGGDGFSAYTGDGGPSVAAGMSAPRGLTVDSTGAVYVAESGNHIVRLLTPAGGAPVLTITSAHTGSFTPASTGQYTVTVTNSAIAGPTSGTVTVSDLTSIGLGVASMSGAGWTCGSSSCTRSDTLAGGSSYPAITVMANVANPAPLQATNQVLVSGGGAAELGAEDLTLISGSVPAAPVLISPAFGATGVSLSASLTWNPASGATYYNVFFGTTSPPPFAATTTSTNYSPSGLAAGTNYYWQVVAANNNHVASSPIWVFTTVPGGTCTYMLNSGSGTVFAGGGTGSVTVTAPAGCAWMASSNQTWLQVTGAASGAGNGTINYSAASNTGASRSATLIIGGQRFSLTQVGAYVISTIGGGALPPTSIAAPLAGYSVPQGVVTDAQGRIYFTSGPMNAVFRVELTGALTRVAGTGAPGYSGDGGPAISAQFNNPWGLALDTAGNLYISDTYNNRIRKVDLTGTISTVAGNGNCCYSGDNGPATSANINSPEGIAVDSSGNLYIADTNNQRIRKVTAAGTITTVAGNGSAGYSGDTGAATSAQINNPRGVAVDSSGNLYIADTNNYRIREVSSGTITTVAGNGSCCYSGDNGAATSAEINFPNGVAVDSSGNLYIADTNGQRIRLVSGGAISTIAGNGFSGYSGEAVAAINSNLNNPVAVAIDPSGNVYIADSLNQRIRKLAGGNLTTVAGGSINDSGPAPFGEFSQPGGLARDGSGNLYIGDVWNNRVRVITPAGQVSTVAGTGIEGSAGDNGPAASAQLAAPFGVTTDAAGNLYIADTFNSKIRKVGTNGTITTVAGTGSYGFAGDGGQATSAQLATPRGVVLDASGNLYISDTFNQRIRKVSVSGTITTVAGNGTAGYGGDNGSALSAELNYPQRLAVDSAGNLYIADTNNHRVRKVDTSGNITTVAGNGTCCYSGDGGVATNAQLNSPTGVTVDGSGNLYITENNNRVRMVTPGGIIGTIAGNGNYNYSGDGGLASNASLRSPAQVTLDASGNIYVADSNNGAVRLLTPGGSAVLTIASSHTGSFTPGATGQYTITVTNAALASTTSGTVTVAETVPAGLTLTSLSGTGWTCGATSCTRSDALGGGSSYPAITASVNIAAVPGAQLTNRVTVSGGGALMTGGEDLTLVTPVLSVLTNHSGNFTLGQTGATYTITVTSLGLAPTYGTITVTESLPAGLTLVSLAGTGWTCPANGNICTRNDVLPGGGSYPSITATVNVASNAASPSVNSVSVSGGGAATVNTTDSTTIIGLSSLSITKTHVGNLIQGQSGTYTLTVSNTAGTATSGTITVTENVPAGLSLVSMAGAGWTCPAAGTTCTRSDSLAPGTSYSQITVSVTAAANAPGLVTNNVTAAGGGSPTAIANDVTNINSALGGLRFVPMTPCRVVDTRHGIIGPLAGPTIAGGTSRDFVLSNSATCVIPASAQAFSLNVAVVPPAALGFLTLWPSGQPQPKASTLNSVDGRTKSNAAIVPAGVGGAISVFASNTTDVILDINGYFVPASVSTALAFYPVTPCRIADTRKAAAPALVGGQSRTFSVISSSCHIPESAQAYSLNFAAVPPGPLGFITAYPTGQPRPTTATLNDTVAQIVANAAIVPAGTNGSIDIFASNNTNLVIDINGYFAPMDVGGLSLYNVTPCRVLDTRKPAGSPPITGKLDVAVAGTCSIPQDSQAYVFSATVVPPGALGFLTLWPQGQPQPVAATLNAVDGVITSNMALVPTNNGSISAFVSNASHLVLDIFGFFAQ